MGALNLTTDTEQEYLSQNCLSALNRLYSVLHIGLFGEVVDEKATCYLHSKATD